MIRGQSGRCELDLVRLLLAAARGQPPRETTADYFADADRLTGAGLRGRVQLHVVFAEVQREDKGDVVAVRKDCVKKYGFEIIGPPERHVLIRAKKTSWREAGLWGGRGRGRDGAANLAAPTQRTLP